MASEASTKVVTPKARASYVTVFKPKADKKGKEKYSICLVFYPSAETTAFEKAALQAVVAAGRKKFGDKFDAMVKSGKVVLKGGKGASIRNDGMDEKYPGAAFYLNARNENRPAVVDANVQPILDPTEFYSGAYCRASVTAFGYDTEGNQGVSWSLGNIQKIADGEHLDGRSTADQDFQPLAGAELSEIDDLLK